MALAAAGGPEDTTGPDEMAVLRGYTKAPPKCFFCRITGRKMLFIYLSHTSLLPAVFLLLNVHFHRFVVLAINTTRSQNSDAKRKWRDVLSVHV